MLFYDSTRPHHPRNLPEDSLSLTLVILTIGELKITRCGQTGFVNPAAIPYVLGRKLGLLETKA